MHNVEMKAELRDLDLAKTVCHGLKATFIATLEQTDTYYRIPAGRLKKRETTGEPTEYVFYERANRPQPKLSHFVIYTEEQARERFGSEPLPVWVTVKKKRELWMLGNTRIHLDSVEGLGNFLEFESLVCRDHNIARGHESISQLRERFGPALGGLIDCSYSDMLARELEEPTEADL
jgi:adenylate cyclase class IV